MAAMVLVDLPKKANIGGDGKHLELVRDNFCGSTGGKTPPLRVIGDS